MPLTHYSHWKTYPNLMMTHLVPSLHFLQESLARREFRPAESSDERASKVQRIDPDAPVAEPSPKAAQIGVAQAFTKTGETIPVHVNYDQEEYREELKLSEPVIWDVTKKYPELAQKKGMDKEMGSMKDFSVLHRSSH